MGSMRAIWSRASHGAVRKAPVITFTPSFCTFCSMLMSPFGLPPMVYQSWHPYVRTGRQTALKARRQLAIESPHTEFPRTSKTRFTWDYYTQSKELTEHRTTTVSTHLDNLERTQT